MKAARAKVDEQGGLAERLTAAPLPQDAEAAAAKVEAWLAGLHGEEEVALAELARDARVRKLLEGIAEGSPYLWDVAQSRPARLAEFLRARPEELATQVIAAAKAAGTLTDEAEAMRVLRHAKADLALLVGIADIGGAWPVMRVTRALTEFADATVSAAAAFRLREAARTGRVTLPDPDDPERGSGLIVLAMGKMGGFELNYSSDIDLIILFDRDRPLADGVEPTAFYVRLVRGMVKLLQERTADGYVFRTDLRLRPDPASTQIAIATDAALTYYESRGQNWERAAMIKARPCAGDVAAGEAFLREITPFIWRKYLDYPAIADVHAMKRQIHAYKGHDEIAIAGHNIKLGRGGIREIEFFVQTQQLIAGGRHPQLRARETLAVLKLLADGGWIKPKTGGDLAAAYRFLRTVEHRLQMVADEQTHTLPSDAAELERFAHFLGYDGCEPFGEALLAHLRAVQGHYSRLFEEAPDLAAARRRLHFERGANERETLERLSEMGFQRPLEALSTVRCWMDGEYRSMRSEFTRERLGDILPQLFEELGRADQPDGALRALDRFLQGVHNGGRLFAMLRQYPDMVALLGTILGTAPRLAELLAARPEIMDALIDPAFFGALPDEEALARGLDAVLGRSASYEDALDAARMFGQEQMFLIGVRVLSGTVSATQAGAAFARVADVIVRTMHRAAERAFEAQHGRLPDQRSVVLAMGKLGGGEMTASSDLDLIVIYEFGGDDARSDGKRPLYGTQYFARLTQRLISALTSQTNYGSLYQVDMRLRPSGRSGPVATHLHAFRDYQQNEAWTWEHMALTRARVISGDASFGGEVAGLIRTVLRAPRDQEGAAADVVEMRRAIATEMGEDERWDLKYARGGLIDLEFIAQYLQLVHAAAEPQILDPCTLRVLEKAERLGLLSKEDGDVLRPAAVLYQSLTQVLRLCLSGPFKPDDAGEGLRRLLARAGDAPDFPALDSHLADTQAEVRVRFERIVGRLAG